MSNNEGKPMTQQQQQEQRYESAPWSLQAVKFMTAATIGGGLLLLSGLTLTGTVVTLILVTPLLVIFSPILVPAAIVGFLVATGFLFSGGFGVAAITALSWMYKYTTGKHPPGADQLDQARMMVANKARDMTEKAKEYGQYVQHKAQEVTKGQVS